MRTKLTLLISVVLVLGLVNIGTPAEMTWLGGGTNSWCESDNWMGGVPGPTDIALIVTPERGPIVGAGCDVNVYRIHGPAYNSTYTQVMDIIDANVIVQNDWYLMEDHGQAGPNSTVNISGRSVVKILAPGGGVAMRGQDKGIFNLNILKTGSGEPNFFANGVVAGGDAEPGRVYFYMNGGRFQATGLTCGNDGQGGTFTITGGTIILGSSGLYMEGREGGYFKFTLDGGAYVETTGTFGCPTSSNGTGDTYLNSGTLVCGSFGSAGGWYMYIQPSALLKIKGDHKAQMQGYVDAGRINPDPYPKPMVVTSQGYTLVGFDVYQYPAYNPSPVSGTGNICPTGLTLTWSPGDKADQHKVFFGTSLADVNSMTDPCAIKSRGNETYATGWLSYGKTYYWRVDEVNTAEPNSWRGDIWSFSTPSGKAGSPSPFSGRRGLPPGSITLSWTIPCYLVGQTLNYGTTLDANTWTKVNLGTTTTTYPLTVDTFRHYYWRVDVNDGTRVITGDTWNFTTGYGGLLMYYRFDGSVGSALPSPITDDSGNGIQFWKYTGTGSVKYGESGPGVVASTASADFEPSAALYRPDPCAPSELTMDLLRLDGSQYTVEMWIKAHSWTDLHEIWLIYKDGSWGLKMDSPPGCGAGDCDQNFRWFSGGSQTSESPDDLAVLNEWTHIVVVRDQGGDLGAFYVNGVNYSDDGGGQNPPDNNNPVYIGVARRADGSFRGGFFDGLIDEVRIFDIALGSCAFLRPENPEPQWPRCPSPADDEQDVDPCVVTALTWMPGSSATSHLIYFGTDLDDVTNLSTSAYKGTTSSPLWTLTEALANGTVYYWRVVEDGPGGPWPSEVWTFITKYVILDPSLAVWYALDETSGDVAYDRSGRSHHADGADNKWSLSGHTGGCLVFNSDIHLSPPSSTFSTITNKISVGVWLNGKVGQNPDADMTVFDTGLINSTYKMTALVPDRNGSVVWRAGNDSNDRLVWENAGGAGWQGDWHFLFFTKDESAGKMSIYFDGVLAASQVGTKTTLSNIIFSTPFRIGAYGYHSNDYEGSMDDFRIYNRVLSDTEISALFRGGAVGNAWAPRPIDGAQEVRPADVNLAWRAGDYAQSAQGRHAVYFGTSLSAVTDANSTVGLDVYKGRQDPNYYPSSPPNLQLQLNTTYYWRIDEHNDACSVSPWKGKVWKFTVANYLTLDDFEPYASVTDMKAVGWVDGSGTGANPSGSTLYLRAKPFYPVHGGNQCAEVQYNNGNPIKQKYSEVSRKYATGQNWSQQDLKIFTVWFYGKTTNANTSKEQMYVGLSDTANHYAEVRLADLNDMKEAEWHEWNIPLTSFSGVTRTDVNAFYIGFGNRFAPVAGSTGGVFFDDLRLYPARCVYGYGPVGNLYEGTLARPDCRVDYRDVAVMADDWLKSDLNLVIQQPNYTNRVGWWKLDEGSGTFVADSSGKGNHGTLQTTSAGGYNWVNGNIGKAVQFSGGKVRVPDAALLRPQTAVTCTAWAYYSQIQANSNRVVVKGPDNKETYSIEINNDDSFVFQVRDVNGNRFNVETGAIRKNEWMHLAGTYDANTVTAYVNGLPEASSTVGAKPLSQDTNDLAIGNRSDANDRAFTGTVDEVQVYSYGLSAAEVAYIATQGTGNLLLVSAANLYTGDSPQIVNLKDLAILSNNWLKEELWP